MDIIVATQIPSVFDQIGPLCLNSVPPLLPTVSNNGIIGTWNPSVINTATQGTTRYTFTPDKDQCGTRATMDITVSSKIVPSFAPIGPICKEAQAPVLPATSLNGVKGTWNPASINTSTEGTIVYTFTPEPGGCWTSTTLSVIIEPIQTPVFTPIANLCQNSKAPTLSGTSTNGIPGSWNPATINTSIPGTRIYTFTPTPGQCATPATLNITVDPIITTEFTPIANICQNSPAPVLPLVSNNGIAGTWNPATINTSTAGTRRYTFTPAAGLCATRYSMDITIDQRITPAFTQIGTLCLNSAPPVLPLTSNNGITGTWNPSMINTSIAGTTVYTFTPASSQCASTATINITVAPITTPIFTPIADLCQFSAAPALPLISDNGISGTWNPASGAPSGYARLIVF
jgi:hypothetical protein